MAEPKNFGVFAPPLPLRSHMGAGLRPVVVWLPDTTDPDYRARIADQCRRLAALTADEETMASAFEQEAAQTPGWR